DPRRIRERAVTSGIIPPEAAAGLSDRDALALIFAPGFSTASEITNVSGRGVGMDVVKTNVEKIGGAVDVQSTLGRGTTIRVRIPLTLAIIQALLVVVAGKRFAIPQVNLLELFRLEGDVDAQGLEWVHGAPVFRLRGQLLPLVSLRWQLELGDDELQTSYVAVLQADEQRFGLVVDRIEDTEEIVVKPLGAALRQVPVYAGATILGDGQIALILDTMALAHRAGVGNIAVPSEPKPPAEPLHDDRAHLLLVALSDGRCVGVPLEAVERLEEFESARIEQVGGHEVLQYRDRILPLVRLEAPDAATDQDEDAVEHVVVCRHQGTLIGLVIHQVLDIVDTELSVRSPLAGEGELGSAVVGGRVTELLDVAHAVSGLDPAVFARTELSVV
ncbi:MAG: chemotaxis protein CheA, partial [Nocardioidaceae bacterium]